MAIMLLEGSQLMEFFYNLSRKHARPLCTHKTPVGWPCATSEGEKLDSQTLRNDVHYHSSVRLGVPSPSLPWGSLYLSGSVQGVGLMEAHHHPLKCKHMAGWGAGQDGNVFLPYRELPTLRRCTHTT